MKNVFITGAASGIGRATAQYLYEQGWTLGLADINLQGLTDLAKDWDQNRVRCYELDIRHAESVKQVISDFCTTCNGQLTALINNAGVLKVGAFESLRPEDHTFTFEVNIIGLMNVTHSAFEYLKNTPKACVINLSSASSSYGVPELASYSASKFAVKGFTEALELEWSKHNIQVCDVEPPFVATHMLDSQQHNAKVMDSLGVNLKADDVAKVIAKQLDSPKLHRPVGWFYGTLQFLSEFSPTVTKRLIMKRMSQ
jgi:NADP-dependent 3-hydroxy acid dehydrogenase YdfG